MRPALFLAALCLADAAGAAPLFTDAFQRQDGLITNSYALAHSTEGGIAKSADWETASGSLFVQEGIGYTGVPDDTPPNARSTNGTGSATFRLTTARRDFGNVSVSFDLIHQGLTDATSKPAAAWDGCHVVLRQQSEDRFYYLSVNRRDGTAVIKKKAPDSYYNLSPAVPAPVEPGALQNVSASVRDNPDGTVTLTLRRNSQVLATAIDTGAVGGPPLKGYGRVGIYGDNARLKFLHFRVDSLDSAASAAAPDAPKASSPYSATAVSLDQATISWSTESEAFSRVEYGLTPSYGQETDWSAFTSRSHTVNLLSLRPATLYHYRASSRGPSGAVSSSPDLTFTTPSVSDRMPPAITVISPSNGQTVSGQIGLACSASDDTHMAGVQWQLDGNDLGTEIKSAPFSSSWNASQSAPGAHTLRAIARDEAGNRTVSSSISILIR